MNKRGFTLIEIIVATAIFTSVVTIAMGALTSLNKASREARAMRVIMDNANSAMDSMARTIRMGIRFDAGCDGTLDSNSKIGADLVNSGTNCLAFYGPANDSGSSNILTQRIWYRLNAASSSIERNVVNVDAGTRATAPESATSSSAWEKMTAPEVEVTRLKFYVNGAVLDDDQPAVTILMQGIAHVSRTARNFTVQTTITPRTPNSSLIKP